MATQGERRAETRRRLLDAAAELFAERGIERTSIDAIADLAGRTSGAVYDHFGGKEGLLYALLEGWVGDVSAVMGAEMAAARTLDERIAALWRNVVDPPAGAGRWIALEHELWSYATRDEEVRAHLARRYRAMWSMFDDASDVWGGDHVGLGPAVTGLLMGLEMMYRVDPGAVPDELAHAALRSVVVGHRASQESPR